MKMKATWVTKEKEGMLRNEEEYVRSIEKRNVTIRDQRTLARTAAAQQQRGERSGKMYGDDDRMERG